MTYENVIFEDVRAEVLWIGGRPIFVLLFVLQLGQVPERLQRVRVVGRHREDHAQMVPDKFVLLFLTIIFRTDLRTN